MSNSFPQYHQLRAEIEATPLPSTIPDLLRRAEALYGDAVAIDFFEDGHKLSYRKLGEQVRALADGLRAIGVRPGTHVAVMMSNRIEFPVTWLALAELGAVLTPLITSYTARELAFVLKDAEITHLLIESAFLPILDAVEDKSGVPAPANTVVVGDGGQRAGCHDFAQLVESGDPDAIAPRAEARQDDLTTIQYTSGTTGLPKGVMLTHRFWIELGCGTALLWRSLDVRSVLSDHPFYYIDPQWMLVMGLYTGGVVSFTKKMSVRKFSEWIREHRSDIAWMPDPLLRHQQNLIEGPLPSKVLLTYGVSAETSVAVERRLGVLLREAYGMTEIGLGILVPHLIEDPAILGTCGLPAPWRELRVVGPDNQDVADGEPGELWIRGGGICKGYFNRPDANAQTFVDGWFRTGDLAVRSASGYFTVVGRIKDMIKRSGENISAVEVESVLAELDGVVGVAVVPVPDDVRDQEVKAYLQLRDGLDAQGLPPARVLSHCSERLAKFKLPRYLAYVESLPYTPSKKVAKHKLVSGVLDLRVGCFDTVDGVWR